MARWLTRDSALTFMTSQILLYTARWRLVEGHFVTQFVDSITESDESNQQSDEKDFVYIYMISNE